ncbi:MAG: helix-turn-helix domain-containing protein [Bryobacteraceae bacterium]|jgi:hypothetical protein
MERRYGQTGGSAPRPPGFCAFVSESRALLRNWRLRPQTPAPPHRQGRRTGLPAIPTSASALRLLPSIALSSARLNSLFGQIAEFLRPHHVNLLPVPICQACSQSDLSRMFRAPHDVAWTQWRTFDWFRQRASGERSFGSGWKPGSTFDHKHRLRTVRPSEYKDAATLSAEPRIAATIAATHPASLQELAGRTGRQPSNLSRTLRTMEHYGFVRLQRGKRGRVRAEVPYQSITLELPFFGP